MYMSRINNAYAIKQIKQIIIILKYNIYQLTFKILRQVATWSQNNRMTKNLTSQLSQELKQYNKYEDTLDVFINVLIKRSPTIFVLINMTLMIWLVQTIYSSRLDSIPRSIYFFVPFFSENPIVDIYVTKDTSCKPEFDKIILKTFPAIKEDHITRRNITKWSNEGLTFCVQYSKLIANFSGDCREPSIFCSGYCVQSAQKCPITNIKTVALTQKMPTGFNQLFQTQHYRLIYSRDNKNDYIVGLSAQYENLCANDFKYFDKYQKFKDYWNQTKYCGNEGSLPTQIFHQFNKMSVKTFLFNNDIWSNSIQNVPDNSEVTLGTISLIKFDNKSLQCNKAQYMARNLKDFINQQPVKPTFIQSMLIIAFVFFTLSWAWLIGYYCYEGSKKQKNMIMILMSIIELIVISFLYSQNIQMFQSEKIISQIAVCLQTQLQATSHWQFGITNSSPFKSIMYCCTCFLLLQIVAQLIDRQIYVSYYQQVNPQSLQNRCKCC